MCNLEIKNDVEQKFKTLECKKNIKILQNSSNHQCNFKNYGSLFIILTILKS